MSRQRQSGGDHSVNIQGESIVVQTGISIEEARRLAWEVFTQNFEQLAGRAADIAQERAKEMIEKYLTRLQDRNPKGLGTALDPDMQFALLTAQREYARSGRPELADMLADLLVDRSLHTGGSLAQIVLNESIAVVPKLTHRQLAALSLVFYARYTRYQGMTSFAALTDYIASRYGPFVHELPTHHASYQHLEYAGCGTVGLGSVDLESSFLSRYPGLFSRGFTQDEWPTELELSVSQAGDLLIPCLHDPSRMQFNAVDEDTLKTKMNARAIPHPAQEQLAGVESSHRMTPGDVRDFLRSLSPVMSKLLEIWADTPIKNFTLTSVGIAIGHANATRVTGDRDDLTIWIPDDDGTPTEDPPGVQPSP